MYRFVFNNKNIKYTILIIHEKDKDLLIRDCFCILKHLCIYLSHNDLNSVDNFEDGFYKIILRYQ